MPRKAAISSSVLNPAKAFKVALAILILVLAPSDLAIISRYPAISRTDLTAPPAITPEPFGAGLIITLVAPFSPIT